MICVIYVVLCIICFLYSVYLLVSSVDWRSPLLYTRQTHTLVFTGLEGTGGGRGGGTRLDVADFCSHAVGGGDDQEQGDSSNNNTQSNTARFFQQNVQEASLVLRAAEEQERLEHQRRKQGIQASIFPRDLLITPEISSDEEEQHEREAAALILEEQQLRRRTRDKTLSRAGLANKYFAEWQSRRNFAVCSLRAQGRKEQEQRQDAPQLHDQHQGPGLDHSLLPAPPLPPVSVPVIQHSVPGPGPVQDSSLTVITESFDHVVAGRCKRGEAPLPSARFSHPHKTHPLSPLAATAIKNKHEDSNKAFNNKIIVQVPSSLKQVANAQQRKRAARQRELEKDVTLSFLASR